MISLDHSLDELKFIDFDIFFHEELQSDVKFVFNLTICMFNLTRQQITLGPYGSGMAALMEGHLRPLLAPRVYTLPMVRSIGRTMVQGKNYGPQVTVKRLATR